MGGTGLAGSEDKVHGSFQVVNVEETAFISSNIDTADGATSHMIPRQILTSLEQLEYGNGGRGGDLKQAAGDEESKIP